VCTTVVINRVWAQLSEQKRCVWNARNLKLVADFSLLDEVVKTFFAQKWSSRGSVDFGLGHVLLRERFHNSTEELATSVGFDHGHAKFRIILFVALCQNQSKLTLPDANCFPRKPPV